MGRQRLLRNLIASVAVLSALILVVFGLPALDRAVPAGRALIDDGPYLVGAAVFVLPPVGARIDASKTRPGDDRGTVLFQLGTVRYVIVVAPFDGDLTDAAAKLRTKIQETRGYQVTAGESGIRTGSGLPGRAGGYTAPGRSGRYAAFLAPGLSIEVTVSGADLELQRELAGIDRSIASIEHRGGE